jgi:hypothetical protein
MYMESIFNSKFIESAVKEIEKQLAAGQPVTRSAVLKALGYEPTAENQQAISLAIRIGELSGYRVFQKIGIKPDTFIPKRKASKTKKHDEASDKAA